MEKKYLENERKLNQTIQSGKDDLAKAKKEFEDASREIESGRKQAKDLQQEISVLKAEILAYKANERDMNGIQGKLKQTSEMIKKNIDTLDRTEVSLRKREKHYHKLYLLIIQIFFLI